MNYTNSIGNHISAPSAARYYNSDLSIWLSVDPMVDKYPNLSPYTYCADNPVMIIDPDGRDTIFVDKKTGKTNIYNRVGNDVLVCGKRTVTLSRKGIYEDAVSKGKAQGHEDVTLLVGMSSSDARKTFKFMADNTGVEWGYMESVNNNGQTEFLVGSAHNPDTESLIYVKAMCAPEGSVLRYDHSHIYPIHGSSWQKATAGMPSTSSTSANSKKYSDIEAWNDLVRKNPSISIGIRYNKQTIIHVKKGIWQ